MLAKCQKLLREKFVAILFLFVLIVPPVATIGWLRFEKYQLRRQIKRQLMVYIDRNELVKFKFSDQEVENELVWEHAKEFEYQGQMYDVVHRKELGDSTVFWCWWDHEETKLNQQLLSITNRAFGNDPHKKETQTHLITFLKSLYAQEKMQWEACITLSTVDSCTAFCQTFYSFLSSPPTPPPNLS
ncbi:hypothetical protein SAMN04488029_3148 [Reichenbachiella faecimaris]|uniref:Uncharacterized protein n=1 Tax=Reichenbachiella faecimaris TaxID=692418 RepID=A0A1W2GKQ9_REIFA|nr:hypothetical protein SAMN04488029_3148 [Reichenbachiella faecimaris]